MSVPIVCPKCGKAYKVGKERVGQTVRCPCGETILVRKPLLQAKPIPDSPVSATKAEKPKAGPVAARPAAPRQSETAMPDAAQDRPVAVAPSVPAQPTVAPSVPAQPTVAPAVPAQPSAKGGPIPQVGPSSSEPDVFPKVGPAETTAAAAAKPVIDSSVAIKISGRKRGIARPRSNKQQILLYSIGGGSVVGICLLTVIIVWATRSSGGKGEPKQDAAEVAAKAKRAAGMDRAGDDEEAKVVDQLSKEGLGGDDPAARGNQKMADAKKADGGKAAATKKGLPANVAPRPLKEPFAEQSIMVYDTCYANGGSRIVTPDGRRVYFWNSENGQQETSFMIKGHNIRQLAKSPDDSLFAFGSIHSGVSLVEVKDGQEQALEGPGRRIRDLTFSPDGKYLAAACLSEEANLMIWHVKTRKLYFSQRRTKNGGTLAVAFSNDSKTLAYGEGAQLQLLDLETKRVIQTLRGHRADILAVDFSPADGNMVATGGADGDVILWDLQKSRKQCVMAGHDHRVKCLAFSNDGQILASGGMDHVVSKPVKLLLWHVPSGRPAATLDGTTGSVLALEFSPDDQFLLSGGGPASDVQIRQWTLDRYGLDDKPNTIFLTSLLPAAATGFVVAPERQAIDKPGSTMSFGPITLDAKRQANGIWNIPKADKGTTELRYALNGRFKRLTGVAGAHQRRGTPPPPGSFKIFADGQLLWSADTREAKRFDLEISGVRELKLTCGTDSFAHSVKTAWGDLILEKE